MPVFLLDIILILILLAFAWKGYKQGLIDALSSLVACTVGLYCAYRFYSTGAWWVIKWTGWGKNFCRILVFILIFIIINWLVEYLCYLADRFFQLIFKLPFIRKLNSVLGALFAGLEGVLILTIIIFLCKLLPINTNLNQYTHNSFMVIYLTKLTYFVWPFVPNVLKNLV